MLSKHYWYMAPLGVSCVIWEWILCILWHGTSVPSMGPSLPMNAWLDCDLVSLKARSELWALWRHQVVLDVHGVEGHIILLLGGGVVVPLLGEPLPQGGIWVVIVLICFKVASKWLPSPNVSQEIIALPSLLFILLVSCFNVVVDYPALHLYQCLGQLNLSLIFLLQGALNIL